MENFKVTLEIKIDLSESTKLFITSLFGTVPKPAATQAEPKPAATQAVSKPAATQAVSKPAATQAEPKAETSDVTLEMMQDALAKKVNSNRAVIRQKLEELNAPSLSKLDKAHYAAMYEFLTSL